MTAVTPFDRFISKSLVSKTVPLRQHSEQAVRSLERWKCSDRGGRLRATAPTSLCVGIPQRTAQAGRTSPSSPWPPPLRPCSFSPLAPVVIPKRGMNCEFDWGASAAPPSIRTAPAVPKS